MNGPPWYLSGEDPEGEREKGACCSPPPHAFVETVCLLQSDSKGKSQLISEKVKTEQCVYSKAFVTRFCQRVPMRKSLRTTPPLPRIQAPYKRRQ